jgi:ATP-dependent RNA helicase RhlE
MPILEMLQAEGYETPTPIQAKAIPVVLTARDVLGIAQTGTGKTAAFALPIIQRLTTDCHAALRKGCRVLVLSPTRELATQIAESFRTYGRNFDLTVAVVFGGVGHRPQVQAMARGVDVLVATPGRLLDHLGERSINLAATEILVLDEADRMLDLGFLPPIRRIVSHMSARRQNLFFSATMPPEIGKLAAEMLHDPVRVSVSPTAATVDGVRQRVIHVESHNKRALLVELFADKSMSRTLVFTRTKRGADRVARHLDAAGICVAAIHGNKSQSQREQALAAFRASRIRALVATDIAARGIDIDLVTHVVNYELPDVPESYVHRIGRTARAGAQGIAISLCDADERDQLRDIERLTRQSLLAENRRGNATSLSGGRQPEGRPAGRTPDERGRCSRGRQQRSPLGRGPGVASGPAQRRRQRA